MELSNTNESSKNPIPMKYFVIGAAAVLIALILALTLKTTINAEKYLRITEYGYDGYGSISCYIDWDAVAENYGDKLKVDRTKLKNVVSEEDLWEYEYMTDLDIYDEAIEVEIVGAANNNGHISNGDKVEYSIVVDEKLAQCLSCKIKEVKKGTHQISTLKTIDKVDLFANLTVEFGGTSPNGWISIDYEGNDSLWDYFEADKTSGLRNGEAVCVRLTNGYGDEFEMDHFAERFGFIPLETEKTYVVSGLLEYVESSSDLSEEFVEELKAEAEETIKERKFGDWRLDSLTYSGYMFGTSEEVLFYNRTEFKNILYLVYRGKMSHVDGEEAPKEMILTTCYSSIEKGEDGYNKFEGSSYIGKIGECETTFEFFNQVKDYREEYKFELGGEFEPFSNYSVLSDVSEIDAELKQEFNDKAKNVIEDYIKYGYSSDYEVKDLQLFGEIFSSKKTLDGTEKPNDCNTYIIVYSATLSYRDELMTVYYPVCYDGVSKLVDGTVTTINNGYIAGFSFEFFSYRTDGYLDGKKMYQDLVEYNESAFNCYVSDSILAFK